MSHKQKSNSVCISCIQIGQLRNVLFLLLFHTVQQNKLFFVVSDNRWPKIKSSCDFCNLSVHKFHSLNRKKNNNKQSINLDVLTFFIIVDKIITIYARTHVQRIYGMSSVRKFIETLKTQKKQRQQQQLEKMRQKQPLQHQTHILSLESHLIIVIFHQTK